MKKQESVRRTQVNRLERPSTKADKDRMWDDFWEQLPTSTSTKDDKAWEEAIDTSEEQNPNEVIEGQRFNGQGE